MFHNEGALGTRRGTNVKPVCARRNFRPIGGYRKLDFLAIQHYFHRVRVSR